MIPTDCPSPFVDTPQIHLWGESGALAQVLNLRMVWISHKHADHCLGLHALLGAAREK